MLFPFIKIIRPLNVLITFLVVLVGILISQTTQMEFSIYLLVPLSASLIAAAGNIVNDIYDIETDKISHPQRVLVTGTMSIKSAWILNFLLNAASLFIAFSLSRQLFVVAVLTIVFLYFYSTHLQKIPLIGNLTIAAITGTAFIYGGVAVDNVSSAIIPAIFALQINFIRELVKDIQDQAGDKKAGYKTFPIKFGYANTVKLLKVLIILLLLFSFYPFISNLYKIEYFIIVMLFVDPVLVYILKKLFSNEKDLGIVSALLKLSMINGLIAIYFGK